MTLNPSDAFAVLPTGLRKDLLSAFNDIVTNFEQRRWGPAELDGGKLCEAAITILQGLASGGTYEARATKPKNMVHACSAMEKFTTQPRSVRIQIPRVIVALYEIRNNRGVGHAGGDIDPNEMDATAVLYMSKWVLAELVRNLHTLKTTEATEIVETLIERQVSLVWSSGEKKRVLKLGLTWKERTLLLLLSENSEVTEVLLFRWLEHPKVTDFRRNILIPGHRNRLWEYDAKGRTVKLLPPGISEAEKLLTSFSE